MSKMDQARAWEGRTIDGKFPLRQYLGGSDHSAVFLSESARNAAQKTVIKLIDVDTADADNQLSRLRIASGLTHPHLIRIFDVGRTEIDGSSFLYATMEFADEDLSQILPQRALTADEVRDALPPVLEALAFLHGRGFAHGGVKPSNVYAVGEQLKLSLDQATPAGKARLSGKRNANDAPELGSATAFPASDIWALGATLVAALTQKEISSTNATVPENVSEPFRGIARDCLQLDPTRRPSIEQIYSRLQKPAASSVAPPPPAAVPKPPEAMEAGPRPVSRRGIFAVGSVVLLAAIIVLGYFLFRGKGTSSSSSQPPAQSSTETPPPAATTAPANADGKVVRRVEPDIPAEAQHTISGVIKIRARVQVDASGKVTAAKLISSGPSRYFSERALDAAQQWQFSAPVVNGQPVPSVWLIQFRLRNNSVQDSAAQLKP